ncbi:ArpU family phage packaging/lysis transcriptional regulator, partial [Halalkalibacter sp. AB-rgal2]|uniref:ArpU family phage packaging/lysis transcriptional regulator n=1 Tax=Halalkalibacter sp. AB-rgal2 TaxID=3242695 RepID=UPI00359EE02B
MLFKLPEIDRERTREAVLAALEKYRICLLMVEENVLPKVTQSFSLIPPTNTNEFYSSTENAAIKNIARQEMCVQYIERIIKSVNRLSVQERAIIIKR